MKIGKQKKKKKNEYKKTNIKNSLYMKARMLDENIVVRATYSY